MFYYGNFLFCLLYLCIVYTRHTLKQHACLPHRELCFPTTLDTKKKIQKKTHKREKKRNKNNGKSRVEKKAKHKKATLKNKLISVAGL